MPSSSIQSCPLAKWLCLSPVEESFHLSLWLSSSLYRLVLYHSNTLIRMCRPLYQMIHLKRVFNGCHNSRCSLLIGCHRRFVGRLYWYFRQPNQVQLVWRFWNRCSTSDSCLFQRMSPILCPMHMGKSIFIWVYLFHFLARILLTSTIRNLELLTHEEYDRNLDCSLAFNIPCGRFSASAGCISVGIRNSQLLLRLRIQEKGIYAWIVIK